MQICNAMPVLYCGRISNTPLPNTLTKNNHPITVAEVKVSTRNIIIPSILINYSQNLEFHIKDFNPTLSIVYRLVRKLNYTGSRKILERWNYKVSEVIPTTVEEIITIEPLVLNYCDCLESNSNKSFTYLLQIEKIVARNTSFNISNQEISGIVISHT